MWLYGWKIAICDCSEWSRIDGSRIDKIIEKLEGNKFWEVTVAGEISIEYSVR